MHSLCFLCFYLSQAEVVKYLSWVQPQLNIDPLALRLTHSAVYPQLYFLIFSPVERHAAWFCIFMFRGEKPQISHKLRISERPEGVSLQTPRVSQCELLALRVGTGDDCQLPPHQVGAQLETCWSKDITHIQRQEQKTFTASDDNHTVTDEDRRYRSDQRR